MFKKLKIHALEGRVNVQNFAGTTYHLSRIAYACSSNHTLPSSLYMLSLMLKIL